MLLQHMLLERLRKFHECASFMSFGSGVASAITSSQWEHTPADNSPSRSWISISSGSRDPIISRVWTRD